MVKLPCSLINLFQIPASDPTQPVKFQKSCTVFFIFVSLFLSVAYHNYEEENRVQYQSDAANLKPQALYMQGIGKPGPYGYGPNKILEKFGPGVLEITDYLWGNYLPATSWESVGGFNSLAEPSLNLGLIDGYGSRFSANPNYEESFGLLDRIKVIQDFGQESRCTDKLIESGIFPKEYDENGFAEHGQISIYSDFASKESKIQLTNKGEKTVKEWTDTQFNSNADLYKNSDHRGDNLKVKLCGAVQNRDTEFDGDYVSVKIEEDVSLTDVTAFFQLQLETPMAWGSSIPSDDKPEDEQERVPPITVTLDKNQIKVVYVDLEIQVKDDERVPIFGGYNIVRRSEIVLPSNTLPDFIMPGNAMQDEFYMEDYRQLFIKLQSINFVHSYRKRFDFFAFMGELGGNLGIVYSLFCFIIGFLGARLSSSKNESGGVELRNPAWLDEKGGNQTL